VGLHGYFQREIAEHLGLNYATISRLVAAQERMSNNKT
jgi:DNA-binding transcriptional regulator LsrR (DeoR family)